MDDVALLVQALEQEIATTDRVATELAAMASDLRSANRHSIAARIYRLSRQLRVNVLTQQCQLAAMRLYDEDDERR